MKKLLFVLFVLLVVLMSGCSTYSSKDIRGFYLIHSTFSIYSDEEDPMFMEDGKKTSIKSFLPQSNCLPDCIHHKDRPTETLSDGTTIYEYEVEEDLYYFIRCNKSDSKYHNGKDILIGKDKNKLLSFC